MATMVPQMNPTGVNGAGSFNQGTPFNFPGTGSGGPGSLNFGNSMNPMPGQSGTAPFATPNATPLLMNGQAVQPMAAGAPSTANNPSSTPTTAAAPGLSPGSGINPGLSDLMNDYGVGIGTMIYQYLNSNGGYNSALTQETVDAQTNAMGQQIQMGANNLTSMLADMGISSGSSVLPSSLASYETSAATQENSITSQEYYNMWNQSQGREEQMLSQVGEVGATAVANAPNWMDFASLGIQGAGVGLDAAALVGLGIL